MAKGSSYSAVPLDATAAQVDDADSGATETAQLRTEEGSSVGEEAGQPGSSLLGRPSTWLILLLAWVAAAESYPTVVFLAGFIYPPASPRWADASCAQDVVVAGPSVLCSAICRWPWQPTSASPPLSSNSSAPAPAPGLRADNREQVYEKYHQFGMDEFVCPSNFRHLADVLLSFPLKAHARYAFDEEPELTVPLFGDPSLHACLPPGPIVYAQTEDCRGGELPAEPGEMPCPWYSSCSQLFHNGSSYVRAPLILLTGQSDYSMGQFCGLAIDPTSQQASPNLIHWFGQNPNMPEHPRATGLPIGLNCFEHGRSVRRVLTERWMSGRLGQCYAEADARVVKGWVTDDTLALVEKYLWEVDAARRASSSLDREGVLSALTVMSAHQPSAQLDSFFADMNQHWTNVDAEQEKDKLQALAALMAERHANTSAALTQLVSTPNSASLVPQLQCSALVPTLSTSSRPLLSLNGDSFTAASAASYHTALNVLNARECLSTGPCKLAVANFGPTHPRRNDIWQTLCGEDSSNPHNADWLTCLKHSGSYAELPATYHNLSQYLYWLSPQGNGYDSHRTWEALYLGAVPVMERLPITRHLFHDADLPVLLVDDMTRLSKQTLLAHLPRFFNISRDYARRKLHLDYWKALIVGKQREWRQAQAVAEQERWANLTERRCWGERPKWMH